MRLAASNRREMSVTISRLTEIFSRFPGIGPRQAKRFVYHLLTLRDEQIAELTDLITRLPREISQCSKCYRFSSISKERLCEYCWPNSRDDSMIMVISRDVDLEAIEKSRTWPGRYFVLGGTILPLDKDPERKVRINELKRRIDGDVSRGVLKEVVLAMAANTEGDFTVDFLKERIGEPSGVRISVLGRGLSTGTELEYSDSETIKNALKNRS